MILRTGLIVAAFSLMAIAAFGANADEADNIIKKEIACNWRPQPGWAIKSLMRLGAINRSVWTVSDSLNYFRLTTPRKVGGINIVGVFAYDESSAYGFVRAPGTSPGITFGIVTTDSLSLVLREMPRIGSGLQLDDSATNLRLAKDISCQNDGSGAN